MSLPESKMQQPKRGFKRKTIEKTLKSKVGSWLKTLPEALAKEVREDYIVTGGAIASMLQGYLPNDYDLYFQTADIAKKVVDHYLTKMVESSHVDKVESRIEEDGRRVAIMIKSAGIAVDGQEDFSTYQYFEQLPPNEAAEYFENLLKDSKEKSKNYEPALISSNAISLHGNVQLIFRFVGDPEDIHKNYDFVHCTNWYTEKNSLTLRQGALESILAKELRYVGSLYPLCSMFRLKKFIKRGWTITAGEMLKIGWDISKLDLSNPAVLQDQLVGVDYAYFCQVVSCLNDNQEIDRTYLFEVINRVFDNQEINHEDDEIVGDFE